MANRKLVVVRTYSAGVHVGRLVRREGADVTLADARRIWRWSGANTLSEVAMQGIDSTSRISVSVDRIVLTDAIEIIDVAPAAVESLTTSRWL